MKNILILALFLSCTEVGKKEKTVKYFKDVDIFTLQGKGETSRSDYPNVEISDSSNFRILIYNSGNKTIRRVYVDSGTFWGTRLSEQDDTGSIYTIRHNYPNQVVEFSYSDTNSFLVYDIGVLDGDKMVYYHPDRRLFGKPSLDLIDSAIKHCGYEIIFYIEPMGKDMKFVKETYIKGVADRDTFNQCYAVTDKSFFWYKEIKDLLNSKKCN
jgi:hypothetical protein